MRLYRARRAGILLPLLLCVAAPLVGGCGESTRTGTLVTPKPEDPEAVRASDEAARAEAKAPRTRPGRP